MAYTVITDTQVQPDAPVTSDLMFALRDNPTAIADGDAGAPRIRSTALYMASGTISGVPALPPALVPAGATVGWYAATGGTIRCTSDSATGTGGGVALSINGTNVASLIAGQSYNNVLTLAKNDIVRVISTGGVAVANVTFRTAQPSVGLIPWPYG